MWPFERVSCKAFSGTLALFMLQVESLKMQLSEREAELAASQLRLGQLEKDLIELSLANENYR